MKDSAEECGLGILWASDCAVCLHFMKFPGNASGLCKVNSC